MRAHPARFRRPGQALVEFALIAPILMLMLLGVMAGGLYFLAAMQQQNATATLADWTAAHPAATAAEADAFAAAVVPCPAGASVTIDAALGLVMVTIVCPSFAHDLLPILPPTVTTTASASMP